MFPYQFLKDGNRTSTGRYGPDAFLKQCRVTCEILRWLASRRSPRAGYPRWERTGHRDRDWDFFPPEIGPRFVRKRCNPNAPLRELAIEARSRVMCGVRSMRTMIARF